jgi:hypothetical protein
LIEQILKNLSGGHSGNLVSRTLLSWISGWFAKYTRTYDQRVAGLKKVAGRKLLVCLHVDFGSRLCENYFFSGETKYWFVRVAVTAKIIRLRYLPVSIIARKVSPSQSFSFRYRPKQTSSDENGGSGLGRRPPVYAPCRANLIDQWSVSSAV